MSFNRLILLAPFLMVASGCVTRDWVEQQLAVLDDRQNVQESRLDGQEARLDETSITSRQALERATDAGVLAKGKFLFDVMLTDDGVIFDVANSSLTQNAQNRLINLADQLKDINKSVYLEIQGHTDANGNAESNNQLGLERAESVRAYLNSLGVPLGRMTTISYGEDSPVSTNDTEQGRAMNRRVVIVVLE